MIGIYANYISDKAMAICRKIEKRLAARSIAYTEISKGFEDEISLILVVGGDGTVLDMAVDAAHKDIPVLSLNAGEVGFLSRFEENEIDDCVEFIENGELNYDVRPLISATIDGNTFFALNDICVQRIADTRENCCTLSVMLKIGEQIADSFRADGIIVATPTGSTAYSLSAGGAILSPTIPALIATPLCAHTLRSKPIVFSDLEQAQISISGRLGGGIYADGKFVSDIQTGNSVVIKKSDLSVKFLKSKINYYEKLQKKLTNWSEK